MKLKVVKNGARMDVELTTDVTKRPLIVSLNMEQVAALLAMLDTARRAEFFCIEVEL
jgi:hypothetical protein